MCGRFVAATPPDEIGRYFDAILPSPPASLAANHNVAPTDDIAVVVADPDGRRRIDVMRWGLVPGWAKDLRVGARMINARSETLAAKGAFAPALAARRCLVPMDGFYEWPGRQPVFIHRLDGDPMAVAGLWERWHGVEPALRSATVITTAADATIAPIHDRMPVMLPASAWAAWLDPANDDTDALRALLRAASDADAALGVRPVSSAVNRVGTQGPELIEPVDRVGVPVQLSLLG